MIVYKKGDLVKYISNIGIRAYGQVGKAEGLVNPKAVGIIVKGPSKSNLYSVYFQCVAHLANVHGNQIEICDK